MPISKLNTRPESFPPLFGQVFSEKKLTDLCLSLPFVQSSPRAFSGFGLGLPQTFAPGSLIRGDLDPAHISVAPLVHPKCTSAGVRRYRLWWRRSVL